jgi:hypothetical protein
VAAAEQVEGTLALLGGLVDGLDGLEGEDKAQGGDALAVRVVFAVPDEFRRGFL